MPGGCRDARSGATVAIRSDQSAESAGPNAGAETGGGASSRSETGPAGASANRAGSRAGPEACHIGSVTGSRAESKPMAAATAPINRPLAPAMKPVSGPVGPSAPAASTESRGPFKPGGTPPIRTVAATPGVKGVPANGLKPESREQQADFHDSAIPRRRLK